MVKVMPGNFAPPNQYPMLRTKTIMDKKEVDTTSKIFIAAVIIFLTVALVSIISFVAILYK